MAIRNLNLTLRFGAGPLAPGVYAMYSVVLRGLGADVREVVLVRDPRDVLTSILATIRKRGVQPPPEDPLRWIDADFTARIVGVLESWRRRRDSSLLVRYEDLMMAPRETLAAMLEEHRALDARLRELVIMRIGWATGSVYEWTQHWRVALQLGVDEADVLAVRDWRSSDRFGPVERAVLAYTDGLVADREVVLALLKDGAGLRGPARCGAARLRGRTGVGGGGPRRPAPRPRGECRGRPSEGIPPRPPPPATTCRSWGGR